MVKRQTDDPETKYGLGLPPADRPPADKETYTFYNYVGRPFLMTSLTCFKVALCITYLRMIDRTSHRMYRITVFVFIGLLVAMYLFGIGFNVFNCTPVSDPYQVISKYANTRTDGEESTSIDSRHLSGLCTLEFCLLVNQRVAGRCRLRPTNSTIHENVNRLQTSSRAQRLILFVLDNHRHHARQNRNDISRGFWRRELDAIRLLERPGSKRWSEYSPYSSPFTCFLTSLMLTPSSYSSLSAAYRTSSHFTTGTKPGRREVTVEARNQRATG